MLCRQRLVELEQVGAGHYFTHPFFGDLKKKEDSILNKSSARNKKIDEVNTAKNFI
jgi:hypothetical protein